MGFSIGLVCGILLALVVAVEARAHAEIVESEIRNRSAKIRAKRSDVLFVPPVVEAQREVYDRNARAGRDTELSDVINE